MSARERAYRIFRFLSSGGVSLLAQNDEPGDERVSRGTFHSMAVEKLELEAKVKSLESQLTASRRETEEQRGKAESQERDLDAYEAKLSEAEQRAARYEEALRYIATQHPVGCVDRDKTHWACGRALEALSPIDPPLAPGVPDAE